MIYSLRETLQCVAPYLPPALVSPRAFEGCWPLSDRLPAVTSFHYLECRLGGGHERVDFLVCVTTEDGGREVLARTFGHAPGATVAWDQLHAFCSRWVDPSSCLHEETPLIWLELDAVQRDSVAASPSIHYCVHSDLTRSGRALVLGSAKPSASRYEELWNEGLSVLLPPSRVRPSIELLHRCLDGLRDCGRMDHVSVMLGRSPATVKMTATILPRHLPGFLSRIDWPGSTDGLERLFGDVNVPPEAIQFDVDFGTEVIPSVGIGIFDDPVDASRQELLDRLVGLGLCTHSKRDALLPWPGSECHVFEGHRWPARINRRLDVKLVYRSPGSVTAKAYLGFGAKFSLV